MSYGDDMIEPGEPAGVDEAAFARFVRDLRARLVAGAREYGNASFGRPPAELLEELRQEAMDLAGWGFVLATRIERLQRRVVNEKTGAHEKLRRSGDTLIPIVELDARAKPEET